MQSFIKQIKEALQEADYLYQLYVNREDIDDFSIPIFQATNACEWIVAEILSRQGIIIENGKVKEDSLPHVVFMSPLAYCEMHELIGLQDRCKNLISEIIRLRNLRTNSGTATKMELIEFFKAYEIFVAWAFITYPEMLEKKATESNWILNYNKGNIEILFQRNPRILQISRFMAYEQALTGGDINIIKQNVDKNEKKQSYETSGLQPNIVAETEIEYGYPPRSSSQDLKDVFDAFREAMIEQGDRIIEAANNNTKHVIDELQNIKNILNTILAKINDYQYLVQNQMALAVSADEMDRLLEAYANTCVEKITVGVESKYSGVQYAEEESKLQISMGAAWDKLSDGSKAFLVTSKVIYNNLLHMPSVVDYSGVCLLVTKALEEEMSKRFCSSYICYLDEVSGNKDKSKRQRDYTNYPPVLLNQYGKVIRDKDFTLGRVPFVLCTCFGEDATDEEKELNQESLIAYARSELFVDKTDEEIQSILAYYGERIQEITKDYRNKAAHTNQLKRVDAEDCFNIVLDIEKFLKIMLDSFVK